MKTDMVVGPCPPEGALQVPVTPVTAVTPSTTEALISLHNLIKQETYTLDALNQQRLQKHVQKLASAAERSFAKETLLQEQTRFLSRINNEAKIHRSTRSVVLGKAKVMSYEDLEEARATRAAKEKSDTTTVKRKGGRKRRRLTLGAEPEIEMVQINDVPEPTIASAVPWRAPMAQMY